MINNFDIESNSINNDINIKQIDDSNDLTMLLDRTTQEKENNSRLYFKYIIYLIFSFIGIIVCYDLIR
jgi:hypothetical protein